MYELVYTKKVIEKARNEREKVMDKLNEIVKLVDDFVWGPVMLVLLVGTGIFLTIRT